MYLFLHQYITTAAPHKTADTINSTKSTIMMPNRIGINPK